MMRNKKTICGLIATLLAICLLANGACATTIARMNLSELAQSAQIVVRARCDGSQSQLAGGSIWTLYDFTVLETLEGAPPQLLRIRLPGGRIGHVETKIDGVPKFRVGEEVVLFAEQISGGDFSVTSWAQGTFRIHSGATGEPRLTQDTSHFAVFDPLTRSFAAAGIRDISLVEFRKQLGEVLRSANAQQREKLK
jgi:hypothetical protein